MPSAVQLKVTLFPVVLVTAVPLVQVQHIVAGTLKRVRMSSIIMYILYLPNMPRLTDSECLPAILLTVIV